MDKERLYAATLYAKDFMNVRLRTIVFFAPSRDAAIGKAYQECQKWFGGMRDHEVQIRQITAEEIIQAYANLETKE